MLELRVLVRRATANDLPVLGRYGAKLARQHHAYDSRRFKLFEPVEAEHARFFGEQLSSEQAAIVVADSGGEVVGYAFVRVEPESFVDSLAAGAWIHDIYVDEAARGKNVGAQLMDAAVKAAHEFGSSGVMLSVAAQNDGAKRVFEKHGFRFTMHEMRKEL